METWKPVPGYEGLYEVSDEGHVRSLSHRVPTCGTTTRNSPGKTLKPSRKSNGYHAVTLSKDGSSRTFSIHTLVALAFLGTPPQGQLVCHFDGIKTNCRLTNLRYDTPTGNFEDRDRHDTTARGEVIGISKLTEIEVREIRAATPSHGDKTLLAARYGVSKSTVGLVIANRVWKHVV